jgi:hypothetical protein
MTRIRTRLYPSFRPENVAAWERRFIELNQLWVITTTTCFQADVLLHLPDLMPEGGTDSTPPHHH